MRRITRAGLMTVPQYQQAEEDLIARLQLMREQELGHVTTILSSGSESEACAGDPLDDPVVKSLSSERERALDEYRIYQNIVKPGKYAPRSYSGNTLQVGSIHMGKVEERGADIKASPPFVTCNLADYIGDDGRFQLVSFLKLNVKTFPMLFKLAVCLASIRTNEVGCERFFSTAGFVSCPRRTSLSVRNYECLATLKSNIKNVYIDEEWVVNKYLVMEKKKSWSDFDTDDDLRVLNLEREMLAESLRVDVDSLPAVNDEEQLDVAEIVEIDDDEVLST